MGEKRLASIALPLLFSVGLIAMTGPANGQMIVAHRGASHDAPENTLAAFNLAWEQNADGIEADFWLTSDGHVICCHDATTGRTAGMDLDISRSTLAELQQLDVGTWKDRKFANQRMPTLGEVIATVPKGKLIVVELKAGPEIVVPLKEVLEHSGLERSQILVISFGKDVIRKFKREMPDVRAHWLSGYSQDEKTMKWTPTPAEVADTIRDTGADGYGSKSKTDVFDQDFVRTMQGLGVREFHVWTIDDPKVARKYRDLGACAITTNRPGYLRSELETDIDGMTRNTADRENDHVQLP